MLSCISPERSGHVPSCCFARCWHCGILGWLDVAPQAALWDHRPAKATYRLLAENALMIPGPHLDRLRAMARRAGAYRVMGAHERRGGTLYNTPDVFHLEVDIRPQEGVRFRQDEEGRS